MMAHLNTSKSLVRRSADDDVALMPPPPLKRIKRPPKVLNEDDYTSALSDIIARDYFPGVRESQAQQEYLAALDSNDQTWIADAGQKLRQSMIPQVGGRRSERNKAFDRSNVESNPRRAADTPRGYDGSLTPSAASEIAPEEDRESPKELDTTNLSLSSFQSTYTSEDNASFNTVLDKQNQKRREKHAYMWTDDQRIPSARQIAYRTQELLLLKQREEEKANADKDGKALISMNAGATNDRPARPDGWKVKTPDNTFMFFPESIDDDGSLTAQEIKDANSKAGKKEVIHENTRFPPLQYVDDTPPGQIPPSPSINTDVVARRDAARAARSSVSETEYPGGETPRVNGYAFVDEDDPTAQPPQVAANEPSYRDLLAGQVGDNAPNPFSISLMKKREAMHHRMVGEVARKKREKEKETVKGAESMTPGVKSAGNMTPAAKKLMEKLGKTPVNSKAERMSSREMWTPRETPRRKVVK